MKRNILLMLVLSVCMSAMAQQPRVYLFENFTDGKIVYKNGATFKVNMNYDASNFAVMYMQDDVLMEMTYPELVDTIYVADRKMVYHKDRFCEVVKLPNGQEVLVGWFLKKVFQGEKGALGMVTQANVQKVRNLDIMPLGESARETNAGMSASQYDSWNATTEVWKQKSENTYFFKKGDKEYALKSMRNVEKAFKKHKETIKKYVKENHLDMMSTEKALKVIEFLYTLED